MNDLLGMKWAIRLALVVLVVNGVLFMVGGDGARWVAWVLAMLMCFVGVAAMVVEGVEADRRMEEKMREVRLREKVIKVVATGMVEAMRGGVEKEEKEEKDDV